MTGLDMIQGAVWQYRRDRPPERNALQEKILARLFILGSAPRDHLDESGYPVYVYDGLLRSDYWMELVLGLPAIGEIHPHCRSRQRGHDQCQG